jgi:hypothetical protein
MLFTGLMLRARRDGRPRRRSGIMPCMQETGPLVGHPACDRCGNFAELTRVGPRALCGVCLARSDTSAGVLVRESWAVLKTVWAPVALILLCVHLPVAMGELFASVPFAIDQLHGTTFGLWASWTAQLLALRAYRREPLLPGDAITRTLRLAPRLWMTDLLAFLLIALFFVLLIVPGVLRALSYAVASLIILREGCRPREALRMSAMRMRGLRGAAFAAYLVALLPTALLFTMAMIVADSPSPEEGFLPPSSGPLEATLTLAFAAAFVPIYCVTAVLYERSRRRGAAPEGAA